jgi:hypothetical protein
MDALQKIVERKSAFYRNDYLAIQDEASLAQGQRGSDHLWKIAAQIMT